MTRKEPRSKRINDILEASIHEFVEKGYENASMDSIAARSGLTKGGLYYHFKSKDDILIKANEAFMDPVFLFIGEAMTSPDPAEGLAGYIRNYLSHWTAHPRELSFIFLTMTKTIGNERFQKLYRGYTTQMADFFDELYRRGVVAGSFSPFNTRSAAIALMGALDGIIGYLVIDADLKLEQTINDFIESFITIYKGARS